MVISDYDRGICYGIIGWILTVLLLIAVAIRLYSRSYLTRSLGSDDFAIVVATCLSFIGMVQDTIAVGYGLGKHESLLSPAEVQEIHKWSYINWIIVFISYFFIRASVMLFVLRLLPPGKTWQQRLIFVVFFINFAITLIATVSYGVRCQPFRAVWDPVPGSKCESIDIITTTGWVNGILACITDIVVALLPQLLIHDLRMKRSTKISLHVILGFGFVTAALSIGRVAAMNRGVWKTDNSWRAITTSTFSLVEEKCGIIFASAPAIRQFVAYRKRVGTFKVTSKRQYPEEDFVSFRRRVNLRDIFWYRKASLNEDRVTKPQRAFHPPKMLDTPSADHSGATAEKSLLDIWGDRTKRLFGSGSAPSTRANNSTSMSSSGGGIRGKLSRKFPNWEVMRSVEGADNARMQDSAERGQGWPGVDNELAGKHIARRIKGWGSTDDSDTGMSSEFSDSDLKHDGPQRPQEDLSFAQMLSNPVQDRPARAQGRVRM
ncbi:MAG: hypothetical protein M1828_006890 [Chrysothrix sp. TS-e1954]|nr:MAG: hypothetical protein M1828_006890 [Chrysothrix sp. TS-e1954]